jgi:glycosyltransferase involved in cell wall biosynthesis
MGRPIVAAVNGEAGKLLRQSGAAIVVPPADPVALAKAIVEMADTPAERRATMGQAGTEFYRNHLSFSQAMGRTNALLEDTYDKTRAGLRNR